MTTATNHVELSDRARQFMSKLGRSQPGDLKKIRRALDKLKTTPRPSGCTFMFQYGDDQRIWALKAGLDYRVLYRASGEVVRVLVIGPRESVYDEVKNLVSGW